jgi:hypothetical protein
MSGPGIDYGMGWSNVSHETGIRYGVINSHEVLQAWADSSEPYYSHDDIDGNVEFDDDRDIDPVSFDLDDGEYKASQNFDDCDIFIVKSPYYTVCQFCSPCAPGAGYIMNSCEDGVRAYCFGHDWFDDGKAPYPVYSVETGERVKV